jgi:hypothetical protein
MNTIKADSASASPVQTVPAATVNYPRLLGFLEARISHALILLRHRTDDATAIEECRQHLQEAIDRTEAACRVRTTATEEETA